MSKVKLKTHSGAKKRFKQKGNGKFKCKPANLRHILTKKTTKRKRQLRDLEEVPACEVGHLAQMLPNAAKGIAKACAKKAKQAMGSSEDKS